MSMDQNTFRGMKLGWEMQTKKTATEMARPEIFSNTSSQDK
jgi:hypothetical protein